LSHPEGELGRWDRNLVEFLFERFKFFEGSPLTSRALYGLRGNDKMNRLFAFVTDYLCLSRNITQPDIRKGRKRLLIFDDPIFFGPVAGWAKDEGHEPLNPA
jgi:hypothetical protein